MKQDFFEHLPPEITTNIFSRLDVRSIASSKCVSKPWLYLLESDEFVKFHLSRSAAEICLAVLTTKGNSSRYTVLKLEDEIDVESYNHLIKFNFPHNVKIEGSSNGMLFLHKYGVNANGLGLYVCNPISREYIELHCPQLFLIRREATYGFGSSKITGQHKVVRIRNYFDCHVYTLGAGSWRRSKLPSASFKYDSSTFGAFGNGNLHWLVVSDSNDTLWISCFDLETERFSTFFVPPLEVNMGCMFVCFSALRDCLCVCDHSSKNEIVLWLMKEYEDDKYWTKEYVINLDLDFDRHKYMYVYPITVFKDGDVLMLWNWRFLFYYSNKTKTTQEIRVVDSGNAYITSMLLTPSFLSLKSFPMENVISL